MSVAATWLQTAHGRAFDVMDPRASAVHLDDIAHALSNLCRFGGHCRPFYSVAEHSFRVALRVEDLCRARFPGKTIRGQRWWGIVLGALLHDASEAYLIDLPRPLKLVPGLGEVYRSLERGVQAVIWERFGVRPEDGAHEVIQHADDVLLATEKRDLMAKCDVPWATLPAPLPERMNPLDGHGARLAFLGAYSRISRNARQSGAVAA
jgi:uncharacterized protein